MKDAQNSIKFSEINQKSGSVLKFYYSKNQGSKILKA